MKKNIFHSIILQAFLVTGLLLAGLGVSDDHHRTDSQPLIEEEVVEVFEELLEEECSPGRTQEYLSASLITGGKLPAVTLQDSTRLFGSKDGMSLVRLSGWMVPLRI